MKRHQARRFELQDELYPAKRQVLQALHRNGLASRTELASSTGLSIQSLSRIMQELRDMDLVSEATRRRDGGRGQPAIDMMLTPRRLMTVGLVLQHDRIECLLGDLAEGTPRRVERLGDFRTASDSLAAAIELVDEVVATVPASASVLGIGISQSGFFFQPDSSRLISRSDVQGWLQADLAASLSDRFGLPIFIENDGTAAAVGHMVGAMGKRYRSFFVVLLTRGVGGGVVDNGRLVRGRLGNAGELAVLLPADPKAVRPTTESLAAWLAKHWKGAIDTARIERAVAEGDKALVKWLDAAAFVLGQGLRSVTALLDPEVIILAGPLPNAIRACLAERLSFDGPSAGKVAAPAPEVLVDPSSDCLQIGALALPLVSFFDHGRRYAPVRAQRGRQAVR